METDSMADRHPRERQLAVLETQQEQVKKEVAAALRALKNAHETGVDVENATTAYTDLIREQGKLEEIMLTLKMKQL